MLMPKVSCVDLAGCERSKEGLLEASLTTTCKFEGAELKGRAKQTLPLPVKQEMRVNILAIEEHRAECEGERRGGAGKGCEERTSER